MGTMNSVSSEQNEVALAQLKPCDTVLVQTRSSNYRIFLLDPPTGRALVQGGSYLGQPVEATVTGSTVGGPIIKVGSLDVGHRMELSIEGKRLSTSPIQSVRVVSITATDDHK
jgi:hypothetical protein